MKGGGGGGQKNFFVFFLSLKKTSQIKVLLVNVSCEYRSNKTFLYLFQFQFFCFLLFVALFGIPSHLLRCKLEDDRR